jgi:DNA-directed RNA polymerase specialized sigma24 family protein
MSIPQPNRERDRALVEEIRAVDLTAWHRFVHEYGGLILAVLRRHLGRDDDEVRSAFADVLARLYRTGFHPYAGRAALSTWLVVVTRAIAVDRVRRVRGRPGMPEAIVALDALDRHVFELHYRQGRTLEEMQTRLRAEGRPLSKEALLQSIERIEARIDRHLLRRLAYDAEAASVGVISGRLLEYFDRVRAESERLQEQRTPQEELIEREARERMVRIQAMLQELPPDEGEVVRRHLLDHRSARRVASELGLNTSREVYTVLERALRRLRRWIHAREVRE